MADLRDPNVAAQFLIHQRTGHRVPAPQIEGVQVAYVLDNDLTNPIINPSGTCRLIIPAYSAATAFGPVQYPGTMSPPGGGIPGPGKSGGTQCTVMFVPPQINSPTAAIAQIVNFIGWPPAGFITETVVTLSGVSGTQVLDWTDGTVFDATMSGDTTFSFENLVVGTTLSLTLRGAFTPVFSGSIAWQPSAPAYADNGSGMSFEFWVTKVGEIRGAAIT